MHFATKRPQSGRDFGATAGLKTPCSIAGFSPIGESHGLQPPGIFSGGPRGHFRPTMRSDGPLIDRELSAAPAPLPEWDIHPTVVAVHDRRSVITEQYRAARTWLLRRNSAGKHAIVAVTSSIPREGKSLTTANLAVVLSEVRHMNVLAVDCDLRQGTLARLFKIPNAPGLAEVLAGRASLKEAIARTPIGNLFVLPAGDCADLNPTELLNSVGAPRVFDEIRESFHFTLVDTPPVRRLSDVGVIGPLCTGIVVVVRMNKTASHLVRQSVHWLRENHLDVLGCIAADCQTKGARYEYEACKDD